MDVDYIDAQFENGVLTLTLPKTVTTASEGRKIEIQ
ncbi:Hsp20 family protein [Paraburkholderia sp. GAS448]